MDIFHYIQDHWLVLTTIWFPALIGYWNGFIAAAKVMGWNRFADECQKIEQAVEAFIKAKRGQ